MRFPRFFPPSKGKLTTQPYPLQCLLYTMFVACIDTLENYTKIVKNRNFKSHFLCNFHVHACKYVYNKTCVTCKSLI